MIPRAPSLPGAYWRERFVAIALLAQATAARTPVPEAARIRPRLAAGVGRRRPSAASSRS